MKHKVFRRNVKNYDLTPEELFRFTQLKYVSVDQIELNTENVIQLKSPVPDSKFPKDFVVLFFDSEDQSL